MYMISKNQPYNIIHIHYVTAHKIQHNTIPTETL